MFKKQFEDSDKRPVPLTLLTNGKKDFSFFAPIYEAIWKQIPSFITISAPSEDMEGKVGKKERIVKELVKLDFKILAELDGSPIDRGAEDSYLVEKDGLMLYFSEGASFTLSCFYDRLNEAHLSLIRALQKTFDKPKVKKGNVSFICQEYGELSLASMPLKKHKFDSINYNEGMDKIYTDLVKFLGSDGTGMVLFSGPPGVGKSCLIKSLIGDVKKNVVFMGAQMMHSLSDPGFQLFALHNLKDSIFVLEDAENLLSSENGRSPGTANLLSLSDGIYGDSLGIKIICTCNCKESEIDEAVLRKGRLKKKVEFELLSTGRAQILIDNLKIEYKVTKPMALTDIYNILEDNGVKKKETRTMGFGV